MREREREAGKAVALVHAKGIRPEIHRLRPATMYKRSRHENCRLFLTETHSFLHSNCEFALQHLKILVRWEIKSVETEDSVSSANHEHHK